jgi:hypothetical protein
MYRFLLKETGLLKNLNSSNRNQSSASENEEIPPVFGPLGF